MPAADLHSEVAERAAFSGIRYAQCWEDSDVLLEALDVQPNDRCLSVCSGGDNTLSLLSRAPGEVLAVDLSPAQIACLELKVAGFRVLSHDKLLELVGLAPSTRRGDLYHRVRASIAARARAYWDANSGLIERGIASAGRFERYLAAVQRWVLPLMQPRERIESLLTPRSERERREFFARQWNNWRWRALSRVFLSRFVLGRLGRDPAFFDYVEGDVAAPLMRRIEYGLTVLDPSRNPYLQWIALGRFVTNLPHAWRAQNFEPIRNNVDRLKVRVASIEDALTATADGAIDRFNMSDVFEYMSVPGCERVFDEIARAGRCGGRVAYWNMLARRRRPDRLAPRLRTLESLSARLHAEAMTFFYSGFFVDELV